jgi:hypothetical protein
MNVERKMAEKMVAAYPGFTVLSILPEVAKALPGGTDLGHAARRESVIAWLISDGDEAWPITFGASHQDPNAIWAILDPCGAVAMRDHDLFSDRYAWWTYVGSLLS